MEKFFACSHTRCWDGNMSARFFAFLLFCGLFVGHAEAATKFAYPLPTKDTVITAYYDTNRSSGAKRDWNGGSHTYDNHAGSDYGLYGRWTKMDAGVWITAAAPGKVVSASDGQADRCTSGSCSPCNGNYVKIQHSDGKHSYYLHMKKGTVQVKVGQNVKCGDRLGKVGSSGCSTGPHLHFQVNTASSYSTHRCPFVHNDWVSKGSYKGYPSTTCQSGGSTNPPPPTNCDYIKTARLQGGQLNIRPSSNTNQSPVGTVGDGVCLKVLSKTTAGQNISGTTTWYKINHNGATGWISAYYADCSSCGPPAECNAGQTKACYTGAANTRNKGVCKDGKRSCNNGKWGACQNDTKPSAEKCDGKDNDCYGSVDEGNPDAGGSCTTGTGGPCGQGTKQCKGGKIVCEANQPGGTELCDNVDNNCDGQIDEGLSRDCYTGPPNTNGIGSCKGGTQTCNAGEWGSCNGEVKPTNQEVCNNQLDDNCDGNVDEGCNASGSCTAGETRPCYTGPAGTQGVGTCKQGLETCQNNTWSACQNQVLPASQELCGNAQDDNCDGQTDENCSGSDTCVDNDKDGYGVGNSCIGLQDCNDNDPNMHPNKEEVCGNGKDEDCKDGDLPCSNTTTKLQVGQAGCTQASDCVTNFCANKGGVNRCSQPCKLSVECPTGFECVGEQACWPSSGTTQSNCDSASGEKCFQVRGGCGCSSQSEQPDPGLPVMLFLGCLLFMWRQLRRTPHSTNRK